MINTATFKNWQGVDYMTPDVGWSEGITPNISAHVAPYLPLLRKEEEAKCYITNSTGKVVTFAEDGFIIPAGYRIDMAAVRAAGNVTAATHAYTAIDVAQQVRNSNGDLATSGEKVVASMFSLTSAITGATGKSTRPVGTRDNNVQHPVGIAPYNYYRNSSNNLTPPGLGSANPVQVASNNRLYNSSPQEHVAILCDYVCQYAICTSYDPTFEGMAVFIDALADIHPGEFVTYDIDSNLAKANTSTASFFDVVGQAVRVDTYWPKNYTEFVKTRYSTSISGLPAFNDLDRMPGTATEGLPAEMTYANTTVGLVVVNLIRF